MAGLRRNPALIRQFDEPSPAAARATSAVPIYCAKGTANPVDGVWQVISCMDLELATRSTIFMTVDTQYMIAIQSSSDPTDLTGNPLTPVQTAAQLYFPKGPTSQGIGSGPDVADPLPRHTTMVQANSYYDAGVWFGVYNVKSSQTYVATRDAGVYPVQLLPVTDTTYAVEIAWEVSIVVGSDTGNDDLYYTSNV